MNHDSIAKELARRKEEEKCRFFTPNGKQEAAIRMFGEGGNFISLFCGGNGAGKTYLMANILANIIWGPQNEWFDFGLFRDFEKRGYPKRIRIGTESANVKVAGAIDQAISYWWPKTKYEAIKAGMPYVSQYKTTNGWLIDKMSYEQETREWESATLGMVVFDEPPPKDKFTASVARLRQGGLIGIFMTPLMHSAWIMDELVDSHDNKCGVVVADLEDNCKEHGTRGTLEHVNIQRMIDNMDPDEVEARVHGKSMHLSGVILGSAFKRDVHIVPDDLAPPQGCQWGLVVDPARGKPWAMGHFWVDLRGQLVFDSEYPMEDWLKLKETNLSLKDYATVIWQIEKQKPIEWRIIDRHYANARNDNGTTLKADLYEKHGLDFMDSYNCDEEIEVGIQKVKDYLRFKKDDPIHFPKLLVKRRCKNIIRALERWERTDKLVSGTRMHLEVNRLSPYKDHFDLVRYACMANLSVDVPVPMREKKTSYVLGR